MCSESREVEAEAEAMHRIRLGIQGQERLAVLGSLTRQQTCALGRFGSLVPCLGRCEDTAEA